MLTSIQAERGAAEVDLPEGLAFSPVLGRVVRSGEWPDQAISTYDKIVAALEAGDTKEAAALVDFFYDEADVIWAIFRNFIPDINEFMKARGMTDEEIVEANREVLGLLDLPDGRPFNSRVLWEEFRVQVREVLLKCGAADAAGALADLEPMKDKWRIIQDRDVDHAYGLITITARRFGEQVLPELWDHIIGSLFSMRYAKFDISRFPWSDSLETNLYLAFEAMRGHLVGPGRRGNMEFEEDEDRYTFRFDPCGSGGRALRGDNEVEGTPPRVEAPWGYGVTEGEYDFAWNKKGVCYYCSNCCVVMQLKPIDAFGYPVRVVEPPTYPAESEAKCTWHVYKDPTKVPERFYKDVGRTKPERFGSE
jgi:hypothetical protein